MLAGLAVAAAAALVAQSQQDPAVRLPAVPFGAEGGLAPQRPRGGMPPGSSRQGRGGMRFGQLDRSEATDLSPGQLPYDGHYVFARLRYDQGVSPDDLGGGRLYGRRGRGRPGSALVARLPPRRTELHEDSRGDHRGRSVHRAPRRNHRGHRLARPLQVPRLVHGGGRLLDADRRGSQEPARLPAQGRLHDLRRLPRKRLGELRGADEARPAGRAHGGGPSRARALPLLLRHPDTRIPPGTTTAMRRTSSARTSTTTRTSGCCSSRTTTTTSASTWEWSDMGWTPIDLSNEAYKLGVNYIIYALTH